MSYYRTCSRCGAHLDPGEICNCREDLLKEAFNLLCRLDDQCSILTVWIV